MLAIPADGVIASSVSLISVQARKIAHFTALPFPKKSGDFSGTLYGRAIFLRSRLSSLPVFTCRKENPMFLCLHSGHDFFLHDFRHTKKPLHHITNDKRVFLFLISQCYVTALKSKVFACLCNFQSSKSLMGILGYHIGYMAVKILGKIFSMPCGQRFYTYF